jgi:hypothetical protein
MKKLSLVVFGLLAATTVFAQTSPLSYDYVGASLGTGDIYDDDFSFYGVNASYAINDMFFVKGSYYDGATDDDIKFGPRAGKVEQSGYDFGAGFHTPLNQALDLVVAASFVATEAEVFGLSQDVDGYGVEGGLRLQATERLELNLLAAYLDQEDESETGYIASAFYFLTPAFSVGVVYTDNDAADTAAANVRFHF